jgi:hypothetical protein
VIGLQEDCTLVSCCPKRKALMPSTMNHDDAIDEKTGDHKETEMVTFYILTTVGIDLLDHQQLSRECETLTYVYFLRFAE